MGAYLTQPITDKVSSDETNEYLVCGASSMQGWRVSQEDAHNTLLNFDEKTSLFAVYDGHGGAEVALYCAQNLPTFIKESEAYKSGDFEKALEEAFIGFDATIATKEVVLKLKELAGKETPAVVENEASDEEENVNNLCHEANLPLEEVMAKYKEGNVNPLLAKLKANEDNFPLSPFLRARKSPREVGAGSSSSVDGASGSGASCSGAGSSSSKIESVLNEDGSVSSSTTSNGAEKETNSEHQVSTSDADVSGDTEKEEATGTGKEESTPDSSGDKVVEPEQSESAKPVSSQEIKVNGECESSKDDSKDNSISSSQNGEIVQTTVKSGKAKDKTGKVEDIECISSDKDKADSGKSPLRKIKHRVAAALYNSLLEHMEQGEDDSDDDDNDETFEGSDEEADNVNGVDDSSNEEGEGEEEDEDDDEAEEGEEEEYSEEDEYGDESLGNGEEPGADSGCTAVVALLKGNSLYVANAGDSRCIVCRDGKAVDMSIDHKPEDQLELTRIQKAGGKVTSDGRVNGGLNLSRAIGDHCYKQNKSLGASEQMISALPDVKKLTVDPERDQFMVLACDGIWNFMSSQDVVDFIAPRLAEGRDNLSQICEEMFDHCLAPSTVGDGTGCDNMTAVIVHFKDSFPKLSPEEKLAQEQNSNKRSAVEEHAEEEKQEAKRQKVDDSSAVVTSSV